MNTASALYDSGPAFLLNDVSERVRVVCGELACLRGERFDFVLANIYADVLAQVVVQLVSMVRQGGLLLLSGIPIQDDTGIHAEFVRQGCRMIRTLYLEEYLTFIMVKELS